MRGLVHPKSRIAISVNSVLGRPCLGLAGLAYPKRKVPRLVITSHSCSHQHLPTAYFSFPFYYCYSAIAAVADEHVFLSPALGFLLLSASTTQGRSHWQSFTH